MTTLLVPRVGAVMSADIAVPEHEREVRFYSRVLGTGAEPLWREDLMNNLGMPIIGLGERTPELESLPLVWMPHIQVADVAASAARALELGGRELMHGKDGDGNSLWAALFDPNGQAFGIIPVPTEEEVRPPDGASLDDAASVGCIAWLDLTGPDAAATRDFYAEVVGWTVQEVAMEDGGESYADYAMVGPDGNAVAGVCHARGGNQGLPTSWLIYLPVADLAESLRRVADEDGQLLKEVRGSDGEVNAVILEDPVGVSFGLVPG